MQDHKTAMINHEINTENNLLNALDEEDGAIAEYNAAALVPTDLSALNTHKTTTEEHVMYAEEEKDLAEAEHSDAEDEYAAAEQFKDDLAQAVTEIGDFTNEIHRALIDTITATG